MKMASANGGPSTKLSAAAMDKIQKYKRFLGSSQKTPDEESVYKMQMVKALGAESMEEAMAIVKAAGIEKEDIDELMMDTMLIEVQKQD